MSRNWKKFGSPYDPSYSGKQQQRPQDREKQRLEEEQAQHQLRGCGDPDCGICNPETAGRGFTRGGSLGTPTGRSGSATFEIRSGDFMAFVAEATRTRFLDELNAKTDFGRNPPGPPASYTQAREQVQDYLIQAPEQAFDDIVGNDEALEQLRDAIQAPVKYQELYDAYGLKMPKGALLSGPPGCGKTMFARAAASEMRRLYGGAVEFVSISGSELQSMYVGETEGRIKAIFTYAREYQQFHGHPLLVFMDEAEVLLPDRTGRTRRLAPWEESQVATFLAEMDGMQASGAFVLLATNRPEVIDQAVLRDGRCDFKVVVKRPTAAAVESILRKNFVGAPVTGETTLDQLVFAAVESIYDPHKILLDAQAVRVDFEHQRIQDRGHKHFLLEHIISGAMAAAIPTRAKRYAFTRDKAGGVLTGVTVADVVTVVNDLFEENRKLDHTWAFQEWEAATRKELEAE